MTDCVPIPDREVAEAMTSTCVCGAPSQLIADGRKRTGCRECLDMRSVKRAALRARRRAALPASERRPCGCLLRGRHACGLAKRRRRV